MKMMNVTAFRSVTMNSGFNPIFSSPSYAVDGQVFNTLWGYECASTDFDTYRWIVINLENIFQVNYFTLFNKIDDEGKE